MEQRRNGAILIHFLIATYAVIVAKHVCDEYFMPALEYLAFFKLHLSPHVAGATILAAATSISELITSMVSVFTSRTDIAINSLLGSGSYNLLVNTSICCLCVGQLRIKLDKYPIMRDCSFYMLNLIVLYMFLWRNDFTRLYWYENLVSILIFVLFMFINIFDTQIQSCYPGGVPATIEMPEMSNLNQQSETGSSSSSEDGYEAEPYSLSKPYQNFGEKKLCKQILLVFVAPARFLVFLTIMDFRKVDSPSIKNILWVATFCLSLLLISVCSYLLVWMVVVISETFGISEALMGFTFIAAATSLEETMSTISICKRELKKPGSDRLNMALSNCVASNVFDLSIGVGLPYLINSLQTSYFTQLNGNVSFTVFGLIVSVILFVSILCIGNWRLSKLLGALFSIMWLVYTAAVVLIDLALLNNT